MFLSFKQPKYGMEYSKFCVINTAYIYIKNSVYNPVLCESVKLMW